MMNTQDWLPIELLNIGIAAAIFFSCLVISLWKAAFDEANPVYWRRTAALLWVGVFVVAISDRIDGISWPQMIGFALIAMGVVATAARIGLGYYRQYAAQNSGNRRTRLTTAKLSGR